MHAEALIKVLLVDDHAVFRETLAAKLNDESDMQVVGEAADVDAALALLRTVRPDVIVLDIVLPGASTFGAAESIRAQHPGARVLFLSGYATDNYIEQAIAAKAWGYVTKRESFATIAHAIREVAKGWVYYSSDIKARIVAAPDGARLASTAVTRTSQLSAREMEVLRHLANGLSTKEIGAAMHLSPKTVDHHKTSLMAKLDIHDRVELARFAIREGIIPP